MYITKELELGTLPFLFCKKNVFCVADELCRTKILELPKEQKHCIPLLEFRESDPYIKDPEKVKRLYNQILQKKELLKSKGCNVFFSHIQTDFTVSNLITKLNEYTKEQKNHHSYFTVRTFCGFKGTPADIVRINFSGSLEDRVDIE